MADEPHEKDIQDVIERTCRIMMDVRVRVSEITPENVAGYFTSDETGGGLTWEWAERQNRLLRALLQDEDNLDQFLILIIKDELEMLTNNVYAKHRSEDELFEKVYSTMDSADALFFKKAKDDGLLSENLDLLDKAFVINWKEALIEDVRVAKQDNIEEEVKLSDKTIGK